MIRCWLNYWSYRLWEYSHPIEGERDTLIRSVVRGIAFGGW